jgi:tRNA(Phe) wybutosine-synthesizing methylase Tyw3
MADKKILTDSDRDLLLGKLEAAVAGLSLDFDIIQVLAQVEEPEGIVSTFAMGRGNIYARSGQAAEWVAKGHDYQADEDEEEGVDA